MHNRHPSLTIDHLTGLPKHLFDQVLKVPSGARQADLVQSLDGPSQSTVSRALHELIAQKLVRKEGSTKAALFHATDAARYWGTPPHVRAPVPFNPSIFADYVPNQTTWLPADARERFINVVKGHTPMDASTYSKQIAERFLIDLAWASSALEGNTYTLLDTEALIQYGHEAEGRDGQEATMILNHKRAISYLLDRVGDTTLDERMIKNVHGLLMRGLLGNQELGSVRTHAVRVSGTAYRPSHSHPDLAVALNTLSWNAEQIKDPWEAMFVLTAGLSYIQTFEDGNKRVGRLMGNLPLLRAGLPPMSFVGVDKKHYIQGLLAFYEQQDASLLAHSLADGYEQSAPTYEGVYAQRRLPRSVEIRESRRLEEAVKVCVVEALNQTPGTPEQWVGAVVARVAEADRPDFSAALWDILTHLSPDNAAVWGVSSADAEAFQAYAVLPEPEGSVSPSDDAPRKIKLR